MHRFRSLVSVLLISALLPEAWAHDPPSAFPPSFGSVKSDYEPSERVLLDRKGRAIDELRANPRVRRLAWTELRELSPAMRDALLRSEDKRFYDHSGVDWIALGAAALRLPFDSRPRGASTISMQLTRFLNENAKGGRRTFDEKLDQIRAALSLEKTWKKDEIIEAYLNLVSFRGELQGLRAASRGLFAKDPHGLNAEEAAILSVLIRSPNAPPEKVSARACRLLKQISADDENDLDTASLCPGLAQKISALLGKPYEIVPKERLAPVLAARLLPPGPLHATSSNNLSRAKPTREVQTTLDADLQSFATRALREQLAILKSQNVRDGAILVLDNHTGDALAYVANGGLGFSSAAYIDGIQAKRQAGSTLKPFLYAKALENKILTPASLLDDSPADFDAGPSGVYRPRNYDNQFHGFVSVRDALGSSLNVPAVRALLLIGESPAVETLRSLGIRDLNDPGSYGPSLALGTVDVSLWELTNAYRTLARGGLYDRARIVTSQDADWPAAFGAPGKRVFKPSTSFLISDILSDREARRLAFGLESPLATRYWTAVKTGTSKDMRDNWCIGYSDRYTVGVWVGNFAGDSMWNVSGVSGAAPVWLEIMETLHAGPISVKAVLAKRKPPQGVVRSWYELKLEGGKELRKEDFFLSGTEPREAIRPAPGRPLITYPSNGLLIAIDPEIPSSRQRIPFEAKHATPSMTFHLNGKPLASAKEATLWAPQTGPHLLELKSADGRVVDEVRFEVR